MATRRVRVSTLVVLVLTVTVSATEIPATVDAIAARLDREQMKQGPFRGDWDSEWGFNGSVVAGMVDAYECAQNRAYKFSAIIGAEFILSEARSVFMGDEIYGLLRLSTIDGTPSVNRWNPIVRQFFDEIDDSPGGVYGYADLFYAVDPSTAVFYLSHFTVTAYEIQARGKDMWRQSLIRHLARVGDDLANFPVMALGVATWALARTGALDDTFVGFYGVVIDWQGVRLRDLPGLLAGHQVPQGEPFAGSFYWRFDHTYGAFPGAVSGYTEDTIYGTLGLIAAADRQTDASTSSAEEAIRAARDVLLEGVDADGTVYEHLAREGESYYAYAGEMLQGLCAVRTYLEAQATPADPNTEGGQ
jgi:hypothetical protein